MRLLILSIIAFLPHLLNAQLCTPDTTYKKAGIYPKDSILPDAEARTPYEYKLTVIVPVDTEAVVFGSKQKVLIDSIALFKKIDFPEWLDIVCERKCNFKAGDTGCALLAGTPPDSIPDTTYVMGFVTKTFARLEAAPTVQFTQIDSVKNYWTLHLNNPFYNGITLKKAKFNWQVTQVFESLQLQFHGIPEGSFLDIYSLNGIRISSVANLPAEGRMELDVSEIPAGLYIIRIYNSSSSTAKKILIIKNKD